MKNSRIVTIELKDDQDGYEVIAEYIDRYCQLNAYQDVVVSIAASYDGKDYELYNEIAFPDDNCDSFIFLNDWWEGEKFIKILGIKGVSELEIHGGLYEEDEVWAIYPQ